MKIRYIVMEISVPRKFENQTLKDPILWRFLNNTHSIVKGKISKLKEGLLIYEIQPFNGGPISRFIIPEWEIIAIFI